MRKGPTSAPPGSRQANEGPARRGARGEGGQHTEAVPATQRQRSDKQRSRRARGGPALHSVGILPTSIDLDPAWLPAVGAALDAAPTDVDALIVAASGGADSTALAWALARLRTLHARRLDLLLVHCDHGQHPLRHAAADAVRALGMRLGCPTRVIDLGLGAGASERTMRDARYGALGDAAMTAGFPAVATAHHADDQIETLVMRAVRGTGTRGFAGIPRVRSLDEGVSLLRPLLDVRQAELRALVAAAQLPFVEDPTNAALDKTRNHTRHVLLPRLRAARPDLDDAVLAASRRIAARANRIQAAARAWLEPHLRDAHPNRVELRALPPRGPDGREVIRLVHVGLTRSAPLSSWIHRVLALATQPPGGSVDAAVGRSVRVERTRRGLLFFDPRSAAPVAPITLTADGTVTEFGKTGFSVALGPASQVPDGEGFDTRTAPGPYALRSPRPDDRVWSRTGPGAVAHSRSLRRLCASAGIPVADRTRLPLLCDAADRIVWVPGLGVSPFARLGRDTQPILAVARVAPRVGIDLELPAY